MKKQYYLFLFILFCSFPRLFPQTMTPVKPYTGEFSSNLQKKFSDTHQVLKEGLSDKWNDSIYTYYWKAETSSWLLRTKEYLTPSAYKFVNTETYRGLDTLTNTWSNTWLNEYQYFGTTNQVEQASYKLWDSVSNVWLQFSYDHYYSPNIADEYYYKVWNSSRRKFTYGYYDTCQYNSQGKPMDEKGQSLDTLRQLFVNTYRFTYTYDSLSNLLEQVSMSWDTTSGIWGANNKNDFIYDSLHNLIESKKYYWYMSSWLYSYHSLFSNNAAGRPVQRTDLAFNGIQWDTSGMVRYTYNASDTLLMSQLEWSYDPTSHIWTNKSNQEVTYFATGQLKTTTTQLWNTVTSEWMTTWYNKYDSLGNSLDYYYTSVDNSTYVIYSGYRSLNLYDGKERLVQATKQIWNLTGGDWENYSNYITTYESLDNSNAILTLGSLWNGTAWVNNYKDVYYWSYPSGLADMKNQKHLCFYENPLPQGKAIRCTMLDPSKYYQFDLFSMTGENVCSRMENGNTSFVINPSLVPGHYLLRISEEGKILDMERVIVIR